MKTALVFGATGLVGRCLIFELLKNNNYIKIIVLTRRDLVIKHHKLEQHIIDFNNIEAFANLIIADDIFCCIGTTAAATPDKDNYRKTDLEIPLKIGEIALKNGAKQYLLISAMGANLQSNVFYSRLKAQAEQVISNLAFQALHIIRPSLLLGSRNKLRPGEKIAQLIMRVLNPFMLGPLALYKAISAQTVAKALLNISLEDLHCIH